MKPTTTQEDDHGLWEGDPDLFANAAGIASEVLSFDNELSAALLVWQQLHVLSPWRACRCPSRRTPFPRGFFGAASCIVCRGPTELLSWDLVADERLTEMLQARVVIHNLQAEVAKLQKTAAGFEDRDELLFRVLNAEEQLEKLRGDA